MSEARQRYDLYLSYSGRKSYMTCPKQYEFRYVKKEKVARDARSSMFGSAIGKVFEWFYERKLWSHPDPTVACLNLVQDAMDAVFQNEEFDPLTDPGFVTLLRSDLYQFIPRGIESIRSNGFLTVNSRAEEDLTVLYRSDKHDITMKLGGRADFIHGKDKLDIWIVDGKGSQHREKYVDSDQLIWYAVQFYLRYHVAPTRLGFLFWKFPADPVKWIDYGSEDMRNLVDTTCDIGNKIRLKVFDAKASGECHRCDYRERCEDGRKYVAARRVETGGRVDLSVLELEPV